jgi:hypothetical protein
MKLHEQFYAYLVDMEPEALQALEGIVDICEGAITTFDDFPWYGELSTAVDLLSEVVDAAQHKDE